MFVHVPRFELDFALKLFFEQLGPARTAKLEAVTQWVRESKFDQADLALKKLEGDKAKLPPALQAKLGDARRMLDNAKLTNGGNRVPEAGLNK